MRDFAATDGRCVTSDLPGTCVDVRPTSCSLFQR